MSLPPVNLVGSRKDVGPLVTCVGICGSRQVARAGAIEAPDGWRCRHCFRSFVARRKRAIDPPKKRVRRKKATS